ncbi:MAG TPA: ArsR family transcriptional regulator [Candidatus Thermoplasmatota archaeon]|nr:ArsR family transcriptional regulator [Candidatus Thermoplasmatota archaeon]
MSGILEHGTRRTILTTLEASPGLTVGQVAGTLGIHYKTALHHARRLAEAGHLVLRRDGHHARCYLPGVRAPPPAPARALQALHALAQGARTPAELARALGVPRGTAGSLLRRLERASLAVRTQDGWRAAAPEAFTAGAPVGGAWTAASSAR